MKINKIILIMFFLSSALFSDCVIKKDTTQGSSIKHSSSTIDYTKGFSTEHSATVKDYYDDVTVKERTGVVTDYIKGTNSKHSGNVVDYTKSTAAKHTDFVMDYARGTSTESTGTVRDYMKSSNTEHTGTVRDYARGTAIKHTGKVDDVWSNGIVSNKHTGTVVDYVTGSAVAHSNYVKDYADKSYRRCSFSYTYVGYTNNGSDNLLFSPNSTIYISDIVIKSDIFCNLTITSDLSRSVDANGAHTIAPGSTVTHYVRFTNGNYSNAGSTIKNTSMNSCPDGFNYSNDYGKCVNDVRFISYEYVCPAGYTATDNGVVNASRVDNDRKYMTYSLYQNFNYLKPPDGNCHKKIDFDYYDYIYANGSTGGYKTYTKTDPNLNTANPELANNVNTNKTVSNNITHYSYDYYSYSCPVGYITQNSGYSSLLRTDANSATKNPELGNTENSSTSPTKNCYKDMTYKYYSSNCPSGYTAINSGKTSYNRSDPNINTANPELSNNVNSNNSAKNCYKDINFKCYAYSCLSGYTVNNSGRIASRCTKTDNDTDSRNDSTLDNPYFSPTPPTKNCKKAIDYNFYTYSCPSGYITVDAGYSSGYKLDSDVNSYTPELSNALNGASAPSKNCRKNIPFNYYSYNCPNPYTVKDSGKSSYTKTDPDINVDNTNMLSSNANSSSAPAKNCSYDVSYKYYEYSYPAGFVVSDSGYSTYTKTDSDVNANNILELSQNANSATPPAQNASQNISYKYYSYSCPTGYDIDNKGYSSYTKTDTDNNSDNTAELSRNVNSPLSPNKNCRKEVGYDFYSYSCPIEKNSQGYGWEVKNIGLTTLIKTDKDINTNNVTTLSQDGNSQEPAADNCSRKYYECSIDCQAPLVLDKTSGKCVASLEDICIEKGMKYNRTLDKCEQTNECLDSRARPESTHSYCQLDIGCTIIDGVCGELPKKDCLANGFIYNSFTNACEKSDGCQSNQIVLDGSGLCGSKAYCDANKTETFVDCKAYQTVNKVCGQDDEREGNLCYKSSSQSSNISTRHPLVKTQLIGDYKGSSYGNIINSLCSADGMDCQYRLTNIYAANDNKSLCFEDAQGIGSCITTDGNCLFSGAIENEFGIKQLRVEDGTNLVAYDKENEDTSIGSIQSTCKMSGKVGAFVGNDIGKNITSIKSDGSSILFWDEYTRGFIGDIEIVPTISEEDLDNGYEYKDKNVYDLMNKGFLGFYSPENNNTVYAVYKDLISKTECQNLIDGTQFYIAQGISDEENDILSGMSLESGGLYNYNNGNTSRGSCVIASQLSASFKDQNFSVKNVSVPSANTQYVCSPFVCSSHTCQYNECMEGYSPTVYTQSYFDAVVTEDFPSANPSTVCKSSVCDANKPFFRYCGNELGCEANTNIYQEGNGDCVKVECPTGETLNESTGKCEYYGCKNSVERNGKCYKTLNQ